MELLKGESLDRALERGVLSPLRAARIGVSVADALAAMHSANIVHRDLKPGNIFLVEGTDDQVKLLDLGIAKLLPEFFADAEMRPLVEQRLHAGPRGPRLDALGSRSRPTAPSASRSASASARRPSSPPASDS